jgi:hypothetical protein
MATGVRGWARRIAIGLDKLLPRPKATGGAFPRRPIERIVVFGRLPNPTVDYYLAARLGAPGMPASRLVDVRDPALATLPAEGTLVIVCRYASRRLVAWIERHASVLAGVAFFTDDDIGAVITGSEARLGYRLFLWHRAVAPLRRLNRHVDVVWTSTPGLARALADPRAVVLPPAPPAAHWRRDDVPALPETGDGTVRILYHATAVHVREHRFLRPIVEAVLAARPQVRFEVTADAWAARLWAGLERVTVDAPTPWEAYLARTGRERADIVLVPMLRSRANAARAGTKRIDVVRLGAAGIFSASPAYGEADGSGEIRLANRRRRWIEAILRLVDDPEARAAVAAASRALVEAASRSAEEGLPGMH